VYPSRPRVHRTGLFQLGIDLRLARTLREGEATGLKADDIDPENMVLHVRRSLPWSKLPGGENATRRAAAPTVFRSAANSSRSNLSDVRGFAARPSQTQRHARRRSAAGAAGRHEAHSERR